MKWNAELIRFAAMTPKEFGQAVRQSVRDVEREFLGDPIFGPKLVFWRQMGFSTEDEQIRRRG
jgi:hypothetical protein